MWVFICPPQLHERDRLNPSANGDRRALDADSVIGHGERLQTGRAKAVDGRAGGVGRATRPNGRLARNIMTGRAFGHGAAHENVLHRFGLDVAARQRMFDRMTGHRRAMGHVEAAAAAFGERGARSGDDDGVMHGAFLLGSSLSTIVTSGIRLAAWRAAHNDKPVI
jgi:hypothetical protein